MKQKTFAECNLEEACLKSDFSYFDEGLNVRICKIYEPVIGTNCQYRFSLGSNNYGYCTRPNILDKRPILEDLKNGL